MNFTFRNLAQIAFSALALIAFTACGGGSSSPPPIGGTGSGGTDYGGTGSEGSVILPNTTYTVGGTVSGLVGRGLTIELLDLANLAYQATVLEQIDIVTNGPFVFRMPPSQSYGVSIVHQPHSPMQRCVVRNGQGVIGTANATDVGIVCGEFASVTSPKDITISAFGIDVTTGAIASTGTEVTGGLWPYALGNLCTGSCECSG